MKTALAAILLFSLFLGLAAQTTKPSAGTRPQTTTPTRSPQPVSLPSDPNLNAMLGELQRVCQTANGDLGKLHIDKWKADGSEKQQMQQVADSLQKNMTRAVPGLISDLQAAPGSVSKAFKLYHNVTVVYEFLDSLSMAATEYGKKEESTPLSNDVTSLDQARGKLSDYIDQAATNLENQVKKPPPAKTTTSPSTTQTGPKKIIIDDDTPTTKKKKKPSPATTSPPQ